jgi:hypothetical protein
MLDDFAMVFPRDAPIVDGSGRVCFGAGDVMATAGFAGAGAGPGVRGLAAAPVSRVPFLATGLLLCLVTTLASFAAGAAFGTDFTLPDFMLTFAIGLIGALIGGFALDAGLLVILATGLAARADGAETTLRVTEACGFAALGFAPFGFAPVGFALSEPLTIVFAMRAPRFGPSRRTVQPTRFTVHAKSAALMWCQPRQVKGWRNICRSRA